MMKLAEIKKMLFITISHTYLDFYGLSFRFEI